MACVKRGRNILFKIALYPSGSATEMTQIQVHVYSLSFRAVGYEVS